MFEKRSRLSSNEMKKFASKQDFLSQSEKYQGNRLTKLALNEMELRKRIPHYNENDTIRNAAKKATILFNGHVGIVSTVNELKTASEVDANEYVFFRCRSIDAGGFEKNGNDLSLHKYNDNGDYFSVEELLKPRLYSTRDGEEKNVHAFETFVGKLFFTNHKNDDVGEAKGMIINSYYDLEDHCVYCDVMVDAVANSELARAIRDGYLKDVSMGCAVEWSECSVCGNHAANQNEYCDHIKNHKGRRLSGKEVYEINHDLKFIEISAVTEGAFKNCTIDQILDQDEIIKSVKEITEAYSEIPLKTAYQTIANSKDQLLNILKSDIRKVAHAKENGIIITASEEHLSKLYKSMDLIKDVIISMIQMENIDYDYVSDLSKIMKDLQASIFDLASAGFNEEDNTQVSLGNPAEGNPIPDKFQQSKPDAGGAPGGAPGGTPPALQMPMPKTKPEGIASPKEELPLAAMKTINKDDLLKISNKIGELIRDCNSVVSIANRDEKNKELFDSGTTEIKYSNNYSPMDEKMIHSVSLKSLKMEYDSTNDVVSTFCRGHLVKAQSLNKISPVAAALIRSNTQLALENRIKEYKNLVKESLRNINQNRGNTMSTNKVKIAATDKILQRQLEEDLGGSNFKHVRNDHEVDLPILQGLLDELDTSPETGQPEYMLEGRVQKVGIESNQRVNPDHEADKPVGEKQLADGSRRVEDGQSPISYGTGEAQLEQRSNEYTTHRHQPKRAEELLPITEKQMDEANDLGNNRLEYALLCITEDQLKNKREDDSLAGSSGQTKWSGDTARKVTSKDVADLVFKALTNAVVKDGISPAKVVQATLGLEHYPLTTYSATDSIQKFAKPIRTQDDIQERVSLRIAELNHNYGLSSTKTDLNAKWSNVLMSVISSFNDDKDKFLKVLSKKSVSEVDRLRAVASGNYDTRTEEEEIDDQYRSILEEYASEDVPSEVVEATFSAEDFHVDDESEYGRNLTKSDGEKYTSKAVEILQDLLKTECNINVDTKDITIESIDDSLSNEFIKCKAIVKSESLISLAKSSTDEEENDEEDEDNDEEKDEVEAMSKAIRTVMAQQAPGGYVGAPMGGPADQGGGAAPPPPGGGGAGLGAMATPPSDDFSPLDAGGDAESSDDEIGTPKLPGMRCPKCGSTSKLEDIDNKTHCGSCDAEWVTEVIERITKDPSLSNEVAGDDVEEVPEGEFSEGEDIQNELNSTPTGAGAGAGAGGMAPQNTPGMPPLAKDSKNMKKLANWFPAHLKYTDEPEVLALNTLTAVLAMNEEIPQNYPMAPGHRCPNCGSTEMHCENSSFKCCECSTVGKFKITVNKDDNRFADVSLAFIATGKKDKLGENNITRQKYNEKVAKATEVMNYRTASTHLEKPVEQSFEDLVKELQQDGYSLADATNLRDIIVNSMIAEKELQKKANKEGETMSNKSKTHGIQIASEQERDLDLALASDEIESEASEKSKGGKKPSGYICPTPAGDKMNRTAEEEDEISSKAQFGLEEEKDDDSTDDDSGGDESFGGPDDFGGGDDSSESDEPEVEDIVVLDDDEDSDDGSEFDMGDELGGGDGIKIDITTPGGDQVNVSIDPETNEVEVSQEGDLSDEGDDYFGSDDLGMGSEDDSDDGSLADENDFGADLQEDFDTGSDMDMGGEEPEVEESMPSSMGHGGGHSMDSREMDMAMSQEDKEIQIYKTSALMNDKKIHSYASGYGHSYNWDLLAKALGMNVDKVKEDSKRISTAKAVMASKEIDFSNPNDVMRKFLVKSAATTQTMPLDVEDEVAKPQGVGEKVPRKPEVGFKDVDYKPVRSPVGNAGGGVTQVKTDKYQKGSGGEVGGETSVIPRSSGDSGISGIPKATFEEEKANAQTSGNPDSYVQKFTPSMDPESKSSEKNRVRASDIPEIVKIAQANNLTPKDIRVKKFGGLYLANYGNKIWKWGSIGSTLSENQKIEFPQVTVTVHPNGKISKITKAVQKKSASKKRITELGNVYASSGKHAVNIYKIAQNVPEEFIEYADMETEFLVRDKRNPGSFFKIRKAAK